MADATIGEVDIELDGKTVTLQSTPAAAKRVSTMGGGFLGASARVATLDLDACVEAVAAGLNKKAADIEGAVYRAGVANLSGPVSTFVTYLANGGRAPIEATETGTGEA